MTVIGVDPGWEHSGWVAWDGNRVLDHGDEPNEWFINKLRGSIHWPNPILVIEQIASMGMAVGETTFETVYWSGRFAEAWFPKRVERVKRVEIKRHICGQTRATDSNIRQALIDRFGPSTEKAIGKKKTPGPLYGITGHKLSALAVALTWADQHANDPTGDVVRSGVSAEF